MLGVVAAVPLIVGGVLRSAPQLCVVTEDAIDPLSSLHVDDDEAIQYLQDPPTSGPHSSGAGLTGLVTRPIPDAERVAALELGKVIIDFEIQAPEIDTNELVDMGTEMVVIVPHLKLPDPIVATSWGRTIRCSSRASQELLDFIETTSRPQGH